MIESEQHQFQKQQSQKQENPIEDQKIQEKLRIQKLIVLIGDEGYTHYQENIDKLIEQFQIYMEKKRSETEDIIINTLIESITCLPEKSLIYATVTALFQLNANTRGLVYLLIQGSLKRLTQEFLKQNMLQIKNILIYLIECYRLNLINKNVISNIFDQLIEKSEQTINTQFDFYLSILIHTQPNFIEVLKERKDNYQYLIEKTHKLLQNRNKNCWNLLNPLKQQKFNEYLELFYEQMIKNIQNQKINLNYHFSSEFYSEKLQNVNEMEFQNIQLNANLTQNVYYSNFFFNLNEQELSLKTLQNHQIVKDIIDSYKDDKTLLLRKLASFDCFYKDITKEEIVNTFFVLLMQLGNQEYKSILFGSILISWKTVDSQIETIFRNQFKQLYDQMDNIKFSLVFQNFFINFITQQIENMSDMLSFYLINCHLNWNWDDYTFEIDVEGFSMKKNFLRILFARIQQSFQREKMVNIIPQYFHSLFSDQVIIKSQFEQIEQYKQIMSLLNSKSPPDVIIKYIDEKQDYYSVFVEALLVKMSPTFTHLKILFDRYIQVFEKYQQPELIAEILISFWKNSIPHFLKYFAKFTKGGLISSSYICVQIFQQYIQVENDVDEQLHLLQLLFCILQKCKNENNLIITIAKLFINEANEKSNDDLFIDKFIQILRINDNFLIENWEVLKEEIIQTQNNKFLELSTQIEDFISINNVNH